MEEPLEVRLDGKSIAVLMRSPGNDEELAAGFLYTESIIQSPGELESVAHRHDPKNPDLANVVDATTTGGIDLEKRGWQRNFVSASSCGLCGKLTIESVRLQVPSVRDDKLSLTPKLLHTLPDKMRAEQLGFADTGGLHGAALFDQEGNLLMVREDIGRHNAVDKIVGTALLAGNVPLREHVLNGERPREFRDRAKGAHSAYPARRCRLGRVEPRRRARRLLTWASSDFSATTL